GRPIAVVHRIELQALADFPGEVRPYGAWRELHGHLEALVRGRTLAIEISPRDQVPYLDRVPYGVVELLESLGARLVSSAPLVSRFAARWSAAELAGHRKAAEILATVAREALTWVGSEAARGAEVRETGVQQRVRDAMERAGLWTDDGPIVAFGPTSAMPHYEPHAGADRRLAEGDVVLLDRAGCLPAGTFRDAQRDQRVHRHGGSRGESLAPAGRADLGLTGGRRDRRTVRAPPAPVRPTPPCPPPRGRPGAVVEARAAPSPPQPRPAR